MERAATGVATSRCSTMVAVGARSQKRTPLHPSDPSNIPKVAHLTRELARLASIVESSEDAILSKDLSGTICTWNRGAFTVYGYTEEEAIGRSIFMLVPPDRQDEERELLARIGAGERIQHFETVRMRKGGGLIDVSLSISPIVEEGRIAGCSHVARDVSERKRLEIANSQLAAIIASSEDAIIAEDLNGIIQSWNTAAERVYGYTAEEAIGRNIEMLLPPGREQDEQEILEQIRGGGRVDHFETTRLKKGNIPVEVSLTISPVRDRSGAVIGASHVARQIAERKQLHAANARLAAIVESSEDAIVSKDLEGTIETWNASAERIYGYSAAEAIGRNITFLLPQARSAEEREILDKLGRGERVEHFETTRLRKDGQLIHVSLSVSPVRNERGEVVGASHVARDITERKDFEAQMRQTQRLESLGVLAGGIAHDFNNLLTGIIGNATLLSDTCGISNPGKGYLNDLILAAERAADLTRQLLAYSGKGQFVIEAVNVSDVVREIGALVKASIPKSVALRLELNEHVPPIVADRSQIQQLVMNMVINGAEAIGEGRSGSVVVRTGTQHLDEQHIAGGSFQAAGLTPGEYVYVEVLDNGAGMDEQTMAKIFDPFFTTKFTGRGLGLAAALGIVNAHKGAIRVQSAPGEGATFKVLLPSGAGLQHREAAAEKRAILVVDDEGIVRRLAKAALESHGYRVLLASNGQEAVDVFRDMSAVIGLVILDLTMPVMNGHDALGQMRDVRPDVPVLLSSGHAESEAMRQFGKAGLAGFIQKPYTAARLRERVDAVFAENQ
jgi:PAS domain S-box-containing protein